MAKPAAPGNPSESQDQPSPISVLEPPFEEDDNTNLDFSANIKTEQQGMFSSHLHYKVFSPSLFYFKLFCFNVAVNHGFLNR